MHSFVTIDNDNAIIRLYWTRALQNGMTESTLKQLHSDLGTMALGVSSAVGCTYRVEVVL